MNFVNVFDDDKNDVSKEETEVEEYWDEESANIRGNKEHRLRSQNRNAQYAKAKQNNRNS